MNMGNWELKDESAIVPLKKMLQDKDETVRGMAAWAIDRIESSQSASTLYSSLDNDCLGRY